jgi:hypothetical protein
MSTRYLEHLARLGDRWDLLAYQYYGDALAYEQIVAFNFPEPSLEGLQVRLLPPPGVILKIPEPVPPPPDQPVNLPPWRR